MAKRKQDTPRFGKQPPLYIFFANPYEDARFTACPQCDAKTKLRKLPLVIHLNPLQLILLNKTCRYCPHCDLLIVHQNELEPLLANFFGGRKPKIIDDYLVVGTLERATWRRGCREPVTMEEMRENLHDFKKVVEFEIVGGWGRWGADD